jgi:hypothetical protein
MPLSNILISGFNCFHMIPKYNIGDEVISTAIHNYPDNTELSQVFKKVVLINAIYGTVIYDTFRLAEHISTIDFDIKIQQYDLSLIEDMRFGHNILSRNRNQRDLYSFATKYSNWHSQNGFPIYDNLVKRLLPKLNNEYHFHDHFNQSDLYEYAMLKEVVDSLITFTNLQTMKYKEIDKGLWVYAKYIYKRNELPQLIVNNITNAVENNP